MKDFIYTDGLQDAVDAWDGVYLSPSSDNRRKDGVQVFRARWFERFMATSHPAMPGVWFIPQIVILLVLAGNDTRFAWGSGAGVFVLGLLAWTLTEYLLHRFMFHIDPGEDFDTKLKQFLVHGYHHQFPNDRRRLVAPPVLSWPIAVLLALLNYLAAGPYHGMISYAGMAVGYLTYDWVHYYTHHARPNTRLGKFLRRYHLEHHHKDSSSHYGISSPLWDVVFGTLSSKPGSAPAPQVQVPPT